MKLTRRDFIWIVPSAVTAGFFAWLGWRTVNIQLLKKGVGEPVWKDGPRVLVASLAELDAPWKFRYFGYPFRGGELPAVVFSLPQAVSGGLSVGGQHFLALSRVCTHMGCTVNFVDNPELGAIAYNHRTDHPFLGCPCHFGAYEPLQAGKAVYGPPEYPLPRLRLEQVGPELYVTGYEIPFRPFEKG
ncbi:ubiquinol-cytochrome c reductase iron-sulfur subunit [Meiothermus granaticius]|uniref:Arsenite oxidase subunit AioB n=1 Tax=Meiothermus granaticius NBRC 107808 TaxID=1227551 RepID=A0A399FBC9_9DEIN|nr:Rieske 2Fe-2S domain-containing protein [Meiothermus granaticius]MCL6525855.1 Rieske 2Fe-2S domain-containing protein [Thermaceae bacterium]RIH92212.1 Arsenite oxidase subunit AioB [Meiothermus granaticius NBRC 107808]GEM85611.1 cytochrome c biogenesis protein CcsB [Meiothermus granaticius NBRC 107808]